MYETRKQPLWKCSKFPCTIHFPRFSHLLPSSELNLFHEVFILYSSTRRLQATVVNALPPPPPASVKIAQDNWTFGGGGQTLCHVRPERSKTLCTQVKIRGNIVPVQTMRAIFFSGGITFSISFTLSHISVSSLNGYLIVMKKNDVLSR